MYGVIQATRSEMDGATHCDTGPDKDDLCAKCERTARGRSTDMHAALQQQGLQQPSHGKARP